jgi:ferredoxin
MELYVSRVSGLIPERFVCLCIHPSIHLYIHTFILHTYIHAYLRIHQELEMLRRAVNSCTVCLSCRNHSVVRRTVEMGRPLHLCSNWAGQPDNPRHSAIKIGEITRKFLCLVKKWGHCLMACSEDQYLMTAHLVINFWLAKGVFRHFEDREVQEATA